MNHKEVEAEVTLGREIEPKSAQYTIRVIY